MLAVLSKLSAGMENVDVLDGGAQSLTFNIPCAATLDRCMRCVPGQGGFKQRVNAEENERSLFGYLKVSRR